MVDKQVHYFFVSKVWNEQGMHCCSFTGKRHRGYCHKNHKLWLSIKLEQILEASGDQATIRQQPKKKGEKINNTKCYQDHAYWSQTIDIMNMYITESLG